MVKLGVVKRECVATSIHITVRCTVPTISGTFPTLDGTTSKPFGGVPIGEDRKTTIPIGSSFFRFSQLEKINLTKVESLKVDKLQTEIIDNNQNKSITIRQFKGVE